MFTFDEPIGLYDTLRWYITIHLHLIILGVKLAETISLTWHCVMSGSSLSLFVLSGFRVASVSAYPFDKLNSSKNYCHLYFNWTSQKFTVNLANWYFTDITVSFKQDNLKTGQFYTSSDSKLNKTIYLPHGYFPYRVQFVFSNFTSELQTTS